MDRSTSTAGLGGLDYEIISVDLHVNGLLKAY